jgi:hypothetical protein
MQVFFFFLLLDAIGAPPPFTDSRANELQMDVSTGKNALWKGGFVYLYIAWLGRAFLPTLGERVIAGCLDPPMTHSLVIIREPARRVLSFTQTPLSPLSTPPFAKRIITSGSLFILSTQLLFFCQLYWHKADIAPGLSSLFLLTLKCTLNLFILKPLVLFHWNLLFYDI